MRNVMIDFCHIHAYDNAHFIFVLFFYHVYFFMNNFNVVSISFFRFALICYFDSSEFFFANLVILLIIIDSNILLIDWFIHSSFWHRICRPHASLSTGVYIGKPFGKKNPISFVPHWLRFETLSNLFSRISIQCSFSFVILLYFDVFLLIIAVWLEMKMFVS